MIEPQNAGGDGEQPIVTEMSSASRPTKLLPLVLLLVGVWAYWPTLINVCEAWSSNADYSHGYFVPIIAVMLLWARRDLMPTQTRACDWWALTLLLVAGLLRFWAGRFYLPELDGWSIPFWIGGIVWLFYGRAFLAWALPAIGFLWFATPLPATVELLLSTELQLLAAQMGGWVLRLLGQPAFAECTTILLGDEVLDIERACSGLRMFYGIFALSFACVVLARLRGWRATAVLAAAVPVAVVTNVVRIAVTGVLLRKVSGEAARKFSHDLAGFVMIPVAIVLFVLLVFWIRSGVAQFRRDRDSGRRWMLCWSAACVIGVAALFFWGRSQQTHVQAALLDLASQCETEQDWIGATKYLQQYQRIAPSNRQVGERFAEAFASSAYRRTDRIRSVALLYRVWNSNPDRQDLALQAGRAALDLGDSRRSLQICEALIAAEATEESAPGISCLHADALLALIERDGSIDKYTWQDVAKVLEATQASAAAGIRYQVELARLWEQKLLTPSQPERSKRARAILDRLVVDHASNPMAWLARFNFRFEFGSKHDRAAEDEARRDIEQALSLVANSDARQRAMIYSAAASFEKSRGNLPTAEQYLTQAIAATPADPTPVVALAELHRASGLEHKAIDVLEAGLEAIGSDDTMLLLPLASLLADKQDWPAADKVLKTVEASIDVRARDHQQLRIRLGAGLVRAQLAWHEDGAYQAIRGLQSLVNNEEIRIHRLLSPELFSEAHFLLGELYDSLGIVDRASEQFRAALGLDPQRDGLRYQVVFSALEAGDLESAELHCRQLLRDAPSFGPAWAAMVRIHVRRQLRQAPESRDWSLAQRSYANAIAQGISKSELLFAELQMLHAQGKTDAAVELLTQVIATAPDNPTLRRELALLYDDVGDWENALGAADQYLAISPDQIDPYVLKATLLEKTGYSEDARTLLTDLLAKSQGSRWISVAHELASLQLLLGRIAEARALLEKIHDRNPQDLRALDSLANIAWVVGDGDALQRREGQLQAAEGDGGTLWRFYRAQRLLDLAESAEDPRYEEVWRLSKTLQDLRPRWSKTHLLLGDIALRLGQIDAAITSFERGWNLGDRSAFLADRLIALHTRRGRLNAARGYVSQVRGALSLSSQLLDRSIPYFIDAENSAQALKLAEAWVERRPEDPSSHLRLGQILQEFASSDVPARREHLQRAEAAYRAAVELSPRDLDAWLAYASLETADEQSSEQRLASMSNEVGLEGSARSLLFAEIHTELGNMLAAQDHYRRGIELASREDDTAALGRVLTGAAQFYLPKVPALAERYARAAFALETDAESPRQLLLQILSHRQTPEAAAEALEIISGNVRDGDRGRSDRERRLRAVLLAQLETQTSDVEAITLLEALLQQSSADRRLLAKLYEREGRIGPAFEILSELVRSSDALPDDESTFLRFWQDNFLIKTRGQASPDFVGQANAIYQRMLASPQRQHEWLRWKVRAIKLRDDSKQVSWNAVQTLLATLIEATEDSSSWSDSARLVWCRSILQVLLEEQSSSLALRFAEQPRLGLSGADLGIALSHAMIIAANPSLHRSEVNEFLLEVRSSNSQHADLARAVGDYQLMSGQYESAAAAYQDSLRVEPENLLARNNLALCLVELPGKLEDARVLIDEALESNASNAMLLDTRALLLLIAGRADDALTVLEQVLAVAPSDATAILREAMAYRELGQTALMHDAYLKAMSVNITEQLLSPRDRAFLREMTEVNSALVVGELRQPVQGGAAGSDRLAVQADE